MKFNLKSLLNDKVVLYIVLFFAVTNFFGYILLNNYNAIITMALAGLIASYFSKNMIVILSVAILGGTLVTGADTVNHGMHKRHREGFKNGKGDNDKKGKGKDKDKDKDKKEEEKKATKKLLAKAAKNKAAKKQVAKKPKSNTNNSKEDSEEGFSELPESGQFQGSNSALAEETENAIDNLDKFLGSGSIDRLLDQQNALNSSVQTMEPLINNASKLLEGLNNSHIIEKLSTMANNLGPRT
tara:strand:+ start:981 stop:1703 length:723 start_codon:yes stop_codon:yes gene_type:complete